MLGVENVVQQVAATIEARARLTGLDKSGLLLKQGRDGRNNVLQATRRGFRARPARLSADGRCLTAVEHDSERGHVIAGVTVTVGPAAGSVGRQHSAERTGSVGRVGRETAPVNGQWLRQLAIDHSRLHANGFSPDFEDRAEMLAQVNDQAGAERFAGQAGSRASGDERHLMLASVADQGLYVVLVARYDNAEW